MAETPMKPSEMIGAVRAAAAFAHLADRLATDLLRQGDEASARDAFETMNTLHDQAEAYWAEMEEHLNILVPLMASPELDQILARLQAAFEAEGQ